MNHNIIVISGPSGSGKSTLISRLMKEFGEIVFSTSHTTRPIRENEIDGKDYHFVSETQFKGMIEREEFVEWAMVYSNYYGTSFAEVEEKSANDAALLLDIDVQGARNIKKHYQNALFILIAPPSMKALKARLLGREGKMTGNIKKRLEVAKEELEQYELYDYIVINDRLDTAYDVLRSIFTAYKNVTRNHETFLKQLVS